MGPRAEHSFALRSYRFIPWYVLHMVPWILPGRASPPQKTIMQSRRITAFLRESGMLDPIFCLSKCPTTHLCGELLARSLTIPCCHPLAKKLLPGCPIVMATAKINSGIRGQGSPLLNIVPMSFRDKSAPLRPLYFKYSPQPSCFKLDGTMLEMLKAFKKREWGVTKAACQIRYLTLSPGTIPSTPTQVPFPGPFTPPNSSRV